MFQSNPKIKVICYNHPRYNYRNIRLQTFTNGYKRH